MWLYYVAGHKTEHHGKNRVVAIGARAQKILKARMKNLRVDQRIFPIRRDSYTLAVRRACEKLGIEPWTPHQLRHALGQQVRNQFGLEHVQAALGHSEADTSEIYAKASVQRAIEVAAAVG